MPTITYTDIIEETLSHWYLPNSHGVAQHDGQTLQLFQKKVKGCHINGRI